jgi:hypothetical protein
VYAADSDSSAVAFEERAAHPGPQASASQSGPHSLTLRTLWSHAKSTVNGSFRVPEATPIADKGSLAALALGVRANTVSNLM